MPLYEYSCPVCATIHEKIETSNKIDTIICDNCGNLAKKILSIGSFKIKGANVKNGYTISSADKFIENGIK